MSKSVDVPKHRATLLVDDKSELVRQQLSQFSACSSFYNNEGENPAMLRDLQRERDENDPFSQERLDNALARKLAIYPEDSKPVKYKGTIEERTGDNNQQNARTKEILKPGEENFGC